MKQNPSHCRGLQPPVFPLRSGAKSSPKSGAAIGTTLYVENMHGFDWNKLRARYEPLLGDVGHRADLNYVISEMIAESTVEHAYIEGGDLGLPKRPFVAIARSALRILDAKSGVTASPKFSPAKTRRNITHRRSPKWVSMRGSATNVCRSTDANAQGGHGSI